MTLALRTDKPEAEIYIYDDATQRAAYTWRADRQLANELLATIRDQLAKAGADFTAIDGVIVFKGPGSFTGLRIGITVANTVAYAQNAPIVGTMGDNWLADGLARLQQGETDRIVLPHYGAEANISTPKK